MLKVYTIEEVLGHYGVIYKLTSPSGKCYIGQSTNIQKRFYSYKNLKSLEHQPKLYNTLKKHGPENFKYEIIDVAENQIELNNKEIFYIEIHNSTINGYNIKEGGSNGKLSKEGKLYLSKIRKEYYKTHIHHSKGKKLSEEHIRKLTLTRFGKKQSFETIQKRIKRGKDCHLAKKYIFIDNSKNEYIVCGEFKKFVKEHNLALYTCKNYINKGKIPILINPHKIIDKNRENTTGWEIKTINNKS